MCNSVIFEKREYRTPKELTALIGGEDALVWVQPLVPPDAVQQPCLCGVDLPQTLKRAGLRWRHGADPMEFFAERQSQVPC